MNTVPIYDTLKVEPTVTAIFGVPPNLRVYEFGRVPQGTPTPYLVWQLITGLPDNTLSCLPEYDMGMVQIDIYGLNAPLTRAATKAVSDVIERTMYVTSWDGEDMDTATNYYRKTFSVDWFIKR